MRKKDTPTESERENAITTKSSVILRQFQTAYAEAVARGKSRPVGVADIRHRTHLDSDRGESYDNDEAWIQDRLPDVNWGE